MTRSASRIWPTLCAIAKVWTLHPDLRLGQLLNAAAQAERARTGKPGPDLFQMEDADLLRGLAELDRTMDPPR